MLRLSQSFLKAMTALPVARLKRIPKLVELLSANPAAPSLNFERLRGCGLCSARLDLDYRVILASDPQGHALLYVAKHDDAYRWAMRGGSAHADANAVGYDPLVRAPEEESGAVPEDAPLAVGAIYKWSELQRRFRWDTDTPGYYLRERGGRIVCACLRADMNPNAPWEILVGTKPENIRQANLLGELTEPIPVFVKEAVDQWEYWGEFLFDHFETETSEILPRVPESRRDDTSLIAFLRDASADAVTG